MDIRETELNEEEIGGLVEKILVFFVALVAPFVLVVVERYLPYPYLLEELLKLGLVYRLYTLWSEEVPWEIDVRKILTVALVGLVFAVSESMLYLTNAFMLGNFASFGMRLALTVPMHMFTTLVIFVVGQRGKWCWWLGLLIGMGLHYLFNLVVG